jgi:tetratricopeptide (TPR) repeat protein
LAAIAIYALVAQLLILIEAWRSNPLARSPLVDAQTYYDWSGDIAAGRWLSATPFLSAPLYPFLLAPLRALGGGLLTIYGMQLALHIATIIALALLGARRLSPAVGLLSAAMYALLLEPAFYVGRVLTCTLQALLIVALWWQWLRTQQRPTAGRSIVTGAIMGLNCLANPPMLVAAPLLAIWLVVAAPNRRTGVGCGAAALASTAVVIAPSAVHNWIVTNELIPISAQAGITFYQGNSPGAIGVYNIVSGVSFERSVQNLDALRQFTAESGAAPSWQAANRYYLRKGASYLLESPVRAVGLLARKLYWFISGRNFGEIYLPALEISEGLSPRLRLAPLPSAWLMLPALVALVMLVFRRPMQFAPEIVLFGVPLLVALVFFYSPRYRFPVLPVATVLAAWLAVQAAAWRERLAPALIGVAAFAVAIILGPVNRAIGFDEVDEIRPMFLQTVGVAHTETGQVDEAVAWFERALELRPELAIAHGNLGSALIQAGKPEQALPHLKQAVALAPRNFRYHDLLGLALVDLNRGEEALACFRRAVELNPDVPKLRVNLGNALFAVGRMDEALAEYQAVLRMNPTNPRAHYQIGMIALQRGRPADAVGSFREAVRFNPQMAQAHVQLSAALFASGQRQQGLAALATGLEVTGGDAVIANELAWYLSTLPGLGAADRARGLELARKVEAATRNDPPAMLDTLAAALAANGKFEEAATAARRALAKAEQRGAVELAQRIRQRLSLYESGEAYVGPPSEPATRPADAITP